MTLGGVMKFTPDKVEALRVMYETAHECGDETFEFDNYVFLVDYAKYVLQHLDRGMK